VRARAKLALFGKLVVVDEMGLAARGADEFLKIAHERSR
jgi:hypothetical protein